MLRNVYSPAEILSGSSKRENAQVAVTKNGKLFTPEGRNILRGVSRAYVFEIAEQLNIPCHECNIAPYDLYGADEAFITGTPFCILPTTRLNSLKIGNGKMGEITTMLLNKWSENVGVNIVEQIKNYGKEVDVLNQNQSPTPYEFKKNKQK